MTTPGPVVEPEELPRFDRARDPSEVMREALEIDDAAERARRLTELMVNTQRWVEWMSKHRDEAVSAMRDTGASYDQVARALGISKSRAQQLCRRLEQEQA